MIEVKDCCPFGYTTATSEASKNTCDRALDPFVDSESKDINTKSLLKTTDGTYKDVKALQWATHALQEGIKVDRWTNAGRSAEEQKILDGTQLATSQLAILASKKRRKLPYLFVIQAYRKDCKNAGALSVRVYGDGWAALTPLKEIRNFGLRFRGPKELQVENKQVWFGRKLNDEMDAGIFESCKNSCQQLHENCGTIQWPLIQRQVDAYRAFPFRLIDVVDENVIETDFEMLIQSEPNEYHLDYVALSYTWGGRSDLFMKLKVNTGEELLLHGS